jgi:hypothetical protein
MKKRAVRHNQRTRDALYAIGAELVSLCERRVGHGDGQSHAVDLHGVADIEAIVGGEVWWVQVCSSSGASSRKKKILENPNVPILLEAGKVLVFAWDKPGRFWRAAIWELSQEPNPWLRRRDLEEHLAR